MLAIVLLLAASSAAQRTSKIEGVATDSAGKKISNAQVLLFTHDGTVIKKARTDDQGHFSMTGVSQGWFEIKIIKRFSKALYFRKWILVSAGVNEIKPILTAGDPNVSFESCPPDSRTCL